MNIVKPKLQWRTDPSVNPLILSKVDSIALHHMAHTTWTIYDVHNAHLQRDGGSWKGIGYNYWISLDGTVYEGRGLNEGAGVLNHNGHVISIGFQGDYDNANKVMPDAQYNSGVELIQWLKSQIERIQTVAGHKYWGGTECPGRYFPLDEMISGKLRGSQPVDTWKYDGLKSLVSAGLVNDYDGWAKKINDPLPAWAAFIILNRIYEKVKG